jgi:hypothetical protein
MRTALLFAVILATPAFANQVVYKWVDAQGTTHYSDRPVPGAERIEVRVGTTSVVTPSASPASTPSAKQTAADEEPSYRNFEIWKPGNDEVFHNIGGVLDVHIRLEPALRPGHTLSLYLDGRLVEGLPPNTQQFSLQDVYRGTHTLVAVITDQTGERVAQTPPVTFHVRQTSVLNPQNPLNRRRPSGR